MGFWVDNLETSIFHWTNQYYILLSSDKKDGVMAVVPQPIMIMRFYHESYGIKFSHQGSFTMNLSETQYH